MAKHSHQRPRSKRKTPYSIIVLLLLAFAAVFLLRRCGSDKPETPAETAPVVTPAPTEAPIEPEVTPTPTPEAVPETQPAAETPVEISEAAPVNLAMVPDRDGQFPDWIELHNTGSESADLSGWYLSDKESDPTRWAFPEGTVLAPGEYRLVFASRKPSSEGELHASFSLSAGETVYLFDPEGRCGASLDLTGLEKGESAALRDGEIVHTRFVTPGYPNTDEGYAALQSDATRSSPLLIHEAVTSNHNTFYHFAGGGYNDWVELRNMSNDVIEIRGYYLTDDEDDPTKWPLPYRQLFPGEIITYLCSGDESLNEKYYTHTNFKLDGVAEGLYLYHDGELCDYVYLHDIPNEGSIGRQWDKTGFWFIPTSTPHADNVEGFRVITATPTALTEDGVFNGVDSVTVELSGPGPIYYTTDGNIPTAESTPYKGPFTVNKTCVVRAACVESGKLTGTPLTLSYIINENHTLPVASLVAEPYKLNRGIYENAYDYNGEVKQIAASVSLFEEDGSFTADCGLRMFGHTGLHLPKKSFKILFRSRYGEESLHYDLFDSDVQDFTSLVLRSGQDYSYSIIRDELFTELCAEFTDKVLVQQDKYCVLYINGEYWGIYCFKEAFSEDYYASHANVSSESVTLQQAPVPLGSDFSNNVVNYCKTHDMSVPENYQHFCSMVDIDSLIDWAIIEGYTANADVQQNLRYFRSTENGNLWQFAFYDLDWAFYYDINNLSMVFAGIGEDGTELQHTTYIKTLLANEEFCDRFCRRLAEALATTLSDEHVLAKIDELAEELRAEVPRERARWNTGDWEFRLNELRSFVNNGWRVKIIDGACEFCHLSEEQRAEYFGAVDG